MAAQSMLVSGRAAGQVLDLKREPLVQFRTHLRRVSLRPPKFSELINLPSGLLPPSCSAAASRCSPLAIFKSKAKAAPVKKVSSHLLRFVSFFYLFEQKLKYKNN